MLHSCYRCVSLYLLRYISHFYREQPPILVFYYTFSLKFDISAFFQGTDHSDLSRNICKCKPRYNKNFESTETEQFVHYAEGFVASRFA